MKRFFKYAFLMMLGVCAWAFLVEPFLIVVNRQTLELPRWHKEFSDLKIVVAGDFHYDDWFYAEGSMNRIMGKIEAEEPDLILLTGDYVSVGMGRKATDLSNITKCFAKLKAKYGVYAVMGNHDIKGGGNHLKQALREAGVTVIDNKNVRLDINGKQLVIAGIDDFNMGLGRRAKAFEGVKSTDSCIFLTHAPDAFEDLPETFHTSLVISGHTHGGQVKMPRFVRDRIRSGFSRKFVKGLYEEDGRLLFVTSGLGTSLVPARLFVTPEIVVLKLVPKE